MLVQLVLNECGLLLQSGPDRCFECLTMLRVDIYRVIDLSSRLLQPLDCCCIVLCVLSRALCFAMFWGVCLPV